MNEFTNAVKTYFLERFCCGMQALLPDFEKNRNTPCVPLVACHFLLYLYTPRACLKHNVRLVIPFLTSFSSNHHHCSYTLASDSGC